MSNRDDDGKVVKTLPRRLTQVCPSIRLKCGVGNFSRNLANAMSDRGMPIDTVESIPADGDDDLLIQHEYGLFDTAQLRRDLARYRGRAFLLAHSPRADQAFTENIAGFVTLCDDMTLPTSKTLVLPHPGWQAVSSADRAILKKELGWSKYRCVVGTNGFISPTRQFDQIALQLVEFAERENILVYIICPRHQNHDHRPGYRDQEERLVALAAKFPHHLQLEFRFLDQVELNRRLQAMDLAWCWTTTPSLPYGSGTCSDQYGSGTRLVVTNKRQHRHVLNLPNVVAAPLDLGGFAEVLKTEALRGEFPRHDPSPLSWSVFVNKLTAFIADPAPLSVGIASRNPEPIPVVHRSSPAPLTVENADAASQQFTATIPEYPHGFAGRGIVICAGGRQYNTCAWVLIRMLRLLQCRLPIEVWCYEHELDVAWRDLVQSYGVTVRTIGDPPSDRARWDGWQLKSSALLKSVFREVLLLDADIVPVRDPSFLFDTPEFKRDGTLFWPDKSKTPRASEVWRAFGVPYRDEPNQESGQIVVDKARCWKALNLCHWYNVHADFFYRLVYGDKDTFRLAWRRTNTAFAMPSQGVGVRSRYLVQHDFSGEPLFQHCVHAKWNLARIVWLPGFQHQETCIEFLHELGKAWKPWRRIMPPAETADLELAAGLQKCEWRLLLVGSASWPLCLSTDGLVSRGSTIAAASWWVRERELYFGTFDGDVRYRLGNVAEKTWKGKAVANERRVVELLRS